MGEFKEGGGVELGGSQEEVEVLKTNEMSEELEAVDEKELEQQQKREVEDATNELRKIALEEGSQKHSVNTEDYIADHVPDHLKSDKPSLVYRLAQKIGRMGVKEIQGKEELPEEPKLFIANHRGGETGKLIGALNDQVHIASAETINWSRGGMFVKFMQGLGMVPIRESFAHVSEDDRQKVVERARENQKETHQKAIDETGKFSSANVENIRAMVALLLKGEDVAIFAEGPFSRLEEDDRKAYAGYALVAREYKRVTGEDLPVVPTGIRGKKVLFGESFSVDSDGRQTTAQLEDVATEKIHGLYDSLE